MWEIYDNSPDVGGLGQLPWLPNLTWHWCYGNSHQLNGMTNFTLMSGQLKCKQHWAHGVIVCTCHLVPNCHLIISRDVFWTTQIDGLQIISSNMDYDVGFFCNIYS